MGGRWGAGTGLVLGLVVFVALSGCGRAARDLGRGATEGALSAMKSSAPPQPEEAVDFTAVGQDLTQGIAAGATLTLADPELLAQLEAVFERAMAGAGRGLMEGVLAGPRRELLTDEERAGLGLLSEELGRAFVRGASAELAVQLGHEGADGPLTRGLSLAATRASEGLVRGAGNELARGVPGCEGLTQRECVERGLGRLSRAGAQGLSAGAFSGASIWPPLIAFLLGALAMLLVAWGLRLWRGAPMPPLTRREQRPA